MASSTLICDTEPWKDLKNHVQEIKKTHLRDLMSDTDRCQSMMVEFDGILLDYSRQNATLKTMDKLYQLAEAAQLNNKINRMYNGEKINSTENRSVLHVALRAPRDAAINSDGKNVVPEVWKVLDKIKEFSETIRSGSWVGATGKVLKDVVAVGIGGSFLGPLFVHTALQTDLEAIECARGRQLRFLANVDPIDVAKSITGLNPETTLVVVVSKTFTTAETMLNARTLREWISTALGPSAVAKHMVAVSTNLTLVEKFGIDPNNAFAFWDWVGGRYSVCSAVGVLPLSLQYGFSVVEKYGNFLLFLFTCYHFQLLRSVPEFIVRHGIILKFLKGAWSIDQHFISAPYEKNIPVLLGLLSIWNVSFLGHPARVSMESNGKGVSIDGVPLPFEAGEIDFGEPGTNGQHSFYQLIHQGRVIPCDFIGVVKSQQPVYLKGEVVSNHDELMSNFFAQPDALAVGKTFSGNRPSLSLLLPSLNAYNIGQLLAIYEHRIAVEGFIWGINSFDQWGVELGKSLATQVRKQLHASRMKREPIEGFNFSTTTLLTRYLEENTKLNRAVDATDDNSNIPLVNLYQEKFKVDPWVLLETIREFMVDLVVCGHPSALWLIFKGMTRDIFGLKLKQSNIDLVIDFNEDYRLYNNTASSTDGISGLSLEKIRGFPWFDCQRNLAAICAVCLDGVHKGERSRNFSICKHVFHARCIDLWLVRRLTCPTCRSPFKMEPV
ncbi:glucose-6-phosphate isomerase [Citrus sinensis]|uniref:Glucose-6-phosphate isomerase n=1 Tax=Citrus sinensis TaxID=2711 RepID=A0ACB8KWA8_CITSI|nr:glucose-6-phosphate isomerase [Citrus sinensis]